MLYRYSEVLNLPVISADSGKKAGTVKDIIFSPANSEARALLLEHKGLSMNKRIVFLHDLLNLGSDAAIINSTGNVAELDRHAYSDIFFDEGELIGLKVFSKSGGDLGVVRDVLFDYQTGRIEGFEISDGLLEDVLDGRKLLPLHGKVEFGEEFAIFGDDAVEEMEESGGGIRNRLLK